MRLVVTGGAGFIGSTFVDLVLQDTSGIVESVLVLDKITYAGSREHLIDAAKDRRYSFSQVDITDYSTIQSSLRNVTHVVNFAAESHVDQSIIDPRKFIMTNFVGTHSLLESCRSNQVTRMLQVSTDEVYGGDASLPWLESAKMDPSSPYSSSKASAELLTLSYLRTFGLDIVITRGCNTYGRRQHQEKFIPKAIKQALLGEKIPIYGSGKNVREWMHVDDHARGIWLALTHGATGSVYNIGSEERFNNNEIAEQILNEVGNSNAGIEYVTDRLGHDFKYAINSSLAYDELGFNVEHSFSSELSDLVEAYATKFGYKQ